MQNQIDNRKWFKNNRIGGVINPQGLENDRGGLINFPSFHMVNINEVTPIISKNWIISLLYGLGMFGITKVIELYNNEQYSNNKQYSNIYRYIIIASIFIIAGVVFEHIFIIKKYRELKNKAIPVTYAELGKFLDSISTGGDARYYRDSTNT